VSEKNSKASDTPCSTVKTVLNKWRNCGTTVNSIKNKASIPIDWKTKRENWSGRLSRGLQQH